MQIDLCVCFSKQEGGGEKLGILLFMESLSNNTVKTVMHALSSLYPFPLVSRLPFHCSSGAIPSGKQVWRGNRTSQVLPWEEYGGGGFFFLL